MGKLTYQFRDPTRWDVIVFKFPGDAETDSTVNFIKRLIGLPGETVRIQNGDIRIHHPGAPDGEFRLQRKPPFKLLAMLDDVFDNRYMPAIAKLGWPERWRPQPTADGKPAWTSDDYVTFRTDGAAGGENWLRYEHRVPSYNQWRDFIQNRGAVAEEVKPRWITDFLAYNTYRDTLDDQRLRRRAHAGKSRPTLGRRPGPRMHGGR